MTQTFHSLLGWASTFCLAVCGTPQAYKSWKEGHSEGMSWEMLLLWFAGEIFLVFYAGMDFNVPVLANGLLNTAIAGIIIFYKINPRISDKTVVDILDNTSRF